MHISFLNILLFILTLLTTLPYSFALNAWATECHEESAPALREIAPSLTEPIVHAQQLAAQAQTLYEQGRFRESLPLAMSSMRLFEHHLASNATALAQAHLLTGRLQRWLGRLVESEEHLRRALTIQKATSGQESREIVEFLIDLILLHLYRGDLHQARSLTQTAQRILDGKVSQDHPDLVRLGVYLGEILFREGSYEESRRRYETAIAAFERMPLPPVFEYGYALNRLSRVHEHRGELEQARTLVQRALHIRQQALGREHPLVAVTMLRLAQLVQRVENPMETLSQALNLAERVVRIQERSFGPCHPEVAMALRIPMQVQLIRSNISEARLLAERIVSIHRNTKSPDTHLLAESLFLLADVRSSSNDTTGYTQALALLSESVDLLQANPNYRIQLAETLIKRGYTREHLKDLANAKSDYLQAAEYLRPYPHHPNQRGVHFHLTLVNAAAGDRSEACSHFQEAHRRGVVRAESAHILPRAVQDRYRRQDQELLVGYLRLVSNLATDSPDSPCVRDAFLTVEQTRNRAIQAAVISAWKRRTTGSQQSRMFRELDELLRSRERLDADLNDFYAGSNTAEEHPSLVLLKEREGLDHRIAQLREQLRRQAPQTFDHVFPQALAASDIASHLNEREALLSYYATPDRLFIWLLRATHPPLMTSSPVQKSLLKELTNNVRDSTKPQNAFDVEAAYRLWEHLFPSELLPALAGVEHLIVVPDESLHALPFSLLVTEKGSPAYNRVRFSGENNPTVLYTSYAELAWLAKRVAISILPTASILPVVRSAPDHATAGFPTFIGFGDPTLHARQDGPNLKEKERWWHQLPALPGTRNELQTIANTLHAGQEQLYLGPRATESQLHTLNASGALKQTDLLIFATHAMTSVSVGREQQPAIILTRPAQDTKEDDGKLMLDEIFDLDLKPNAWVFLSACETANSDASGEGFSGLARAFLYAGARSLLVSHWQVADESTSHLMRTIVARLAGPQKSRGAQAAQQAMLEMIAQGTTAMHPEYSHPYYWAPFSLVGEGWKGL